MTEPGGGDQILANADFQRDAVYKENTKKQMKGIGYIGEYQPSSSLALKMQIFELFDKFNIEGDDSGALGVTQPVQYIDNFPTPNGDILNIRGQFHDTGKPYAVAYQNPENPKEIFIVKGQAQEATGSIGIDSGPTFVPDSAPLSWSTFESLPVEFHGLPIIAAFSEVPRKPQIATSSEVTADTPTTQNETIELPYYHREIVKLLDVVNNPNSTIVELTDSLYDFPGLLLINQRNRDPIKKMRNLFDDEPLPETSPKHPTKARNGDRITCIFAEDPNNTTTLYQELVLGVFGDKLILLKPQSESSPTTPTPLETVSDLDNLDRWEYEHIPYLISQLRPPGTPPNKLLVGHIT